MGVSFFVIQAARAGQGITELSPIACLAFAVLFALVFVTARDE